MRKRLAIAILTGTLFGTGAVADDVPDAIAPLIEQLADPDPVKRASAAQSLLALGEQARPALREAERSTDPAISAAARELLLRLPWHRPDDPENLRLMLTRYGDMDIAERIGFVEYVASLEDAQRLRVLVRLAQDDPNNEIGWRVVARLRPAAESTPATRESLEKMLDRIDPAIASAPVLAMRGWIVYRDEPAAALRWFEQSIARMAGEEDPTGEMQRVATAAIDAAIETARFESAASMLRVRAGSSDPMIASSASLQLLALHADHGPLAGFENDLEAMRLSIGEPLLLIGVARLQDRAGRRLLADGLRQTAVAGLIADADELFNAADQLVHVGWSNEAVPLLGATVDRAMDAGLELLACNAHLRLSRIARQNARPLPAARHLERAFELGGGGVFIRTDRLGNSTPWTDDEVRTEIAWLYLEAARQDGNAADVDRRIDALLPLAHTDSSITLALLVLLHERDRHADMRPLFDRARAVLQRTLDASPDDAAALNNLAWLMARSGMDVEAALPLARRAVELRPESAGYLDTLAEATFRSGDVEGAIRLQTRALELRPGDAFLTQQLDRFRTTSPDRVPLPSDD